MNKQILGRTWAGKTIMKQWAKHEEQIERMMGATVGMYGDLQGIAGKSLQEVKGLESSVPGVAATVDALSVGEG
ncbi:MAG: hypothetical protein FD134_6 [Gallionellaceae bacterium]|nr:MAG: hypothetical protein FD134_6 [Gallionellaceae bacterium]